MLVGKKGKRGGCNVEEGGRKPTFNKIAQQRVRTIKDKRQCRNTLF